MAKAGDAYQDAVAAVARQLDPTARIEIGEWVEGPDGERDCDVGVYPSSGSPRFVYIECKDRKRPVGIEFVDCLESKRKDVKADIAILCSNSGFTRDALRKAARVGIPALSALMEGDSRIRVQVEEEIYTRKIQVSTYQSTYHFVENLPEMEDIFSSIKDRDVLHNGRPVAAWVRDQCIALLCMTGRSCRIVAKYKFWRPLQFHFGVKIAAVRGLDLTIPCRIQWCSQIIRLSASAGMYDYLRHRVILGKGQQQYHMQNVDYGKWTPINFVPHHFTLDLKPQKGEVKLGLGLVTGIDNVGDVPAPDINSFIESELIERTDPEGESERVDRQHKADKKKATLLSNRPRIHIALEQGRVRGAPWRGPGDFGS